MYNLKDKGKMNTINQSPSLRKHNLKAPWVYIPDWFHLLSPSRGN